jgi:hypothetical protein
MSFLTPTVSHAKRCIVDEAPPRCGMKKLTLQKNKMYRDGGDGTMRFLLNPVRETQVIHQHCAQSNSLVMYPIEVELDYMIDKYQRQICKRPGKTQTNEGITHIVGNLYKIAAVHFQRQRLAAAEEIFSEALHIAQERLIYNDNDTTCCRAEQNSRWAVFALMHNVWVVRCFSTGKCESAETILEQIISHYPNDWCCELVQTCETLLKTRNIRETQDARGHLLRSVFRLKQSQNGNPLMLSPKSVLSQDDETLSSSVKPLAQEDCSISFPCLKHTDCDDNRNSLIGMVSRRIFGTNVNPNPFHIKRLYEIGTGKRNEGTRTPEVEAGAIEMMDQ